MMITDPHSTRLFPKGRGAAAYEMTGLAARCDWVILSDNTAPQVHFHRNTRTATPQTIFLSLRAAHQAIRYFCDQILPVLHAPFVLVSGSEDMTIPVQTDQRWRCFDAQERSMIAALAQHPLLLHWFAENLDQDMGSRVSPLPLGFVFPQGQAPVEAPLVPPLAQRPGLILCSHRLRSGPQWEPRHRVSRLARTDWADWCSLVEEEVSESEYLELVRQHVFVLCVEGGGLDPSPKAWQTILHGAIPIIRNSPLSAAYRELPTAIVDSWSPEQITLERLARWQQQLAPMVETQRGMILERLSGQYWWDKIAARTMAIPEGG